MTHHRNRPKKQPQSSRSTLPMILMLAGILVLGVGAFLALSRRGSAGAPDLQLSRVQASPQAAIDGLKVDYGEMKLGGEQALLQIQLTNTGSGALRFEEEPYVELAAGC
jgi:hypothetical protein